jgi:hypothetical protein
LTELFAASSESPERTSIVWRVIAFFVALVGGFVGSYSGLTGGGLHSGFAVFGFVASATGISLVAAVFGLAISERARATGLAIAFGALGLVLGAWIGVLITFALL